MKRRSDGIVFLPAEFLAPAVKPEVEQLEAAILAASQGYGSVVARPRVVDVARHHRDTCHLRLRQRITKQSLDISCVFCRNDEPLTRGYHL